MTLLNLCSLHICTNINIIDNILNIINSKKNNNRELSKSSYKTNESIMMNNSNEPSNLSIDK